MYLRRPLMLCAAALATLAIAGCGPDEEERLHEPIREGLSAPVDGLDYTVFITRQLNLRDPEDKGYYAGKEAAPGRALYAVFVEACNDGDKPIASTREFEIHDAQGEEFFPKVLPASNPYAYKAGMVAPKNCNPARGSLPQQGPASGAMLLFDLPLEAAENRPLELIVTGRGGTEATFELDI